MEALEFLGIGILLFFILEKNSSILTPATAPITGTSATGVHWVSGSTYNIPTDALFDNGYYVLDISSQRYGYVGQTLPPDSAHPGYTVYQYNPSTHALTVARQGTQG